MNSTAEQRQTEFAFTDAEFRKLQEIIRDHTGIELADHKKPMVYSRLVRRLRALGLTSFREYIAYISGEGGEAEMADFMNAVTTNLTKFFREAHHFEHLRDEVLKPLALHPPEGKRLRLWSAGCSSGMETYSMAITTLEAIPDADRWNCRLLATDIDRNMLAHGKAGRYQREDVEAVPPELRMEYFHRCESGQVEVIERLRQLITFNYMNFIEPWPLKGPFDAIFCRNVVIYFNKDTQRVLFESFANVLKPGGWLYIGHSENLHGISDRFELIGKTIYRKIK